jgi:hypothetical protein
MRTQWVAAALVLLVVATRLCHSDLVWIEEAYPMAAAAEILRGKILYRDIWFDKPPLYALVYTLWGTTVGLPLRVAGAMFVCASCYIAWRFARDVAGETAGVLAAALLAVYLTFDIASSVMALAPDLLMVPLHLAALYFAWKGRGFLAGFLAGVAMWFNTKAFLVLAACLLWCPKPSVLFGFVLPNAVSIALLWWLGALRDYWEQVWVWGFRYSRDTFLTNPIREGLLRTLNWIGFHATLFIGILVLLWRRFSWRVAAWIALGFAGVCMGSRFFPRYYFLLLVPMLIAGVQGLFLLRPKWRVAVLCLTIIPIVRFGPRYVMLAVGDRNWPDLALMIDSRRAASIVRDHTHPGDRLLVWGYRPDVFVYSGLPAATRFLDSQPLTGVFADRHLISSTPSVPELAAPHLKEIGRPEFIVDGLGPINPALAISRYVRMDDYIVAGQTRNSTVYAIKR